MYNLIDAWAFEMFYGEKGSGKTLGMTALTHNDLKRTQAKIHLYSNYDLKPDFFKGLAITKKNNFHKLLKADLEFMFKEKLIFKNSIFLIDEFHTWLDSRNFAKGYNKHFFYFVGQLRKRGNVLRGTTHDKSLIDIRGRLYQEIEIYCYKGLINTDNEWELELNYNKKYSDEELDRCFIKMDYILKKLVHTKSLLPEFAYFNILTKYIKVSDFISMYDTEEFI